MKLAEALAERSDCQRRIEELKKRMARSARVQEGEQPAEDPTLLLAEVEATFSRLQELVSSINRTNARTPFNGNLSISDAIAERDATGKKRDLYAGVADAASTRQDRYSKSEVKFFATIPITDLQRRVDDLSKHFRELDYEIARTQLEHRTRLR